MLIPPLHTALPNNTTRPLLVILRGLSPLLAPLSIGSRISLHNFLLPLELLLVRSPLLKKSMFVSSPVLSDMLKLRTCSCISAQLQTHNFHCVYRILYVGPRLKSLSILYMSFQSDMLYFMCSIAVLWISLPRMFYFSSLFFE